MNVLLATPNFHQPRGNTVTVQRISDGLNRLGVQTSIISMTENHSITRIPQTDLVHGFHAYRFFKFKEKLDVSIDNYVITLTGTDLNHDLFDETRRSEVLRCLTEAKAIHVFDKDAKSALVEAVPLLESKIFIIHQGAGDFQDNSLQKTKEANTFLFVLPAGIRKIKNVPGAIKMLSELHERYPSVRLWLVGPIIEESEGDLVKDLVADNSDWITYLGQLDHSQMGSVYNQADAILNTSVSEGQSSAILEGMGYGLPLLVSSNNGNRSIVTHEKTGLIYRNQSEFLDYAEQIMNNIELRNILGNAAKEYIDRNHSSTYEANQILAMYKHALN